MPRPTRAAHPPSSSLLLQSADPTASIGNASLSIAQLRGAKPGKQADKKAAKGAPAPPAKERAPHDYLGDLDLPSSDSESGSEGEKGRAKEAAAPSAAAAARGVASLSLATDRDAARIAARERKAAEIAAREKEAALADDDAVFDVSFEAGARAGAAGDDGATAATASATDIKVGNLTIRAKGKILLDGATLSIVAGRRYGLAGPNGKGKSTLLRMIARRQVPVPDGLDVLLVEQEVVGDGASALEAVLAADARLAALRAEEAELTAAGADATDAAGARLAEVYDEIEALDGGSAEARASKILHGLGFDGAAQGRATKDFSGGWRMRISLARALYVQPTLLLLDEPTNHLDLRAVLWLEEYLQRWKKTLVVVSHDRGFLNAITTDVIHLHDCRLHYYRGNFEQFEEMYEQKRREVNNAADKYDKAMKAAKRSGGRAAQDKVKTATKAAAKGKGGGGKGKRGDRGGGDDAPAADDAPRRWADYNVTFKFPAPTALPTASLLQLRDASFQYPGRPDFGLSRLNIGIDMGSRVAIVGPNGAGKTTLMNLLAGDLTPAQGEQSRSHSLRVARYAQHFVDALTMDETPVEYLLNRFRAAGLRPESARAQLGRFGLAGHHHLQPIAKLSGGQKARVVFTAISLSNPHVLLLDEVGEEIGRAHV